MREIAEPMMRLMRTQALGIGLTTPEGSTMSTVTAISQDNKEAQSKALFRRLLLPIDGSELSLRAFRVGLDLAKSFDATVLALHVVPPFNSIAYITETLAAAEMGFSQQAIRSASRYLDKAKALAKEAQVPCECHYAFGEHPHEAILEAANEYRCDLIVMATHGWHGLDRLVLGSETQKVLARSSAPVLVCR